MTSKRSSRTKWILRGSDGQDFLQRPGDLIPQVNHRGCRCGLCMGTGDTIDPGPGHSGFFPGIPGMNEG